MDGTRWTGGVAICSEPCNWRVAGSNLRYLPQATAWLASSDKLLTHIIVCDEGNGKPPHSSQPHAGGVKAIEPAFGQRTITISMIVHIGTEEIHVVYADGH